MFPVVLFCVWSVFIWLLIVCMLIVGCLICFAYGMFAFEFMFAVDDCVTIFGLLRFMLVEVVLLFLFSSVIGLRLLACFA